MDTTYVNIMLVVFLVVAALAIDVGYMYVSDEDLKNASETAALAGAKTIKQRIQNQAATDPGNLLATLNDTVQSSARSAAIDMAMGDHAAVALVDVLSNNKNALSEYNDITVGFWNISTHTYAPGGTPVNAIQVRTKRTAESASVGLGPLGVNLAKMTGAQTTNYTPDTIAAMPPRASANILFCAEACDAACTYPSVCAVPERKMFSAALGTTSDLPAANRYAYTSLLYPVASTSMLSDLVCGEMPAQEVCGKQIHSTGNAPQDLLRDIEAMMYNPNADKSNKEYDKASGKLIGWWVIAPVSSCTPARNGAIFEVSTVTKYALVRISRVCASGPTGCSQNYTSFDAPPEVCTDGDGLYIDRISCVNCGSGEMLQFPGLHPVIVK